MRVEIITPDKKIFDDEVELIRVPGSKGSFEMLENHAPIISTLEKGTIKIREMSGNELFFEIDGGVVENKANHIIVLVETA